jgi:hypothetical protein
VLVVVGRVVRGAGHVGVYIVVYFGEERRVGRGERKLRDGDAGGHFADVRWA